MTSILGMKAFVHINERKKARLSKSSFSDRACQRTLHKFKVKVLLYVASPIKISSSYTLGDKNVEIWNFCALLSTGKAAM